MFSKNDKISKRQIFRLLTYDLLGVATLLLPTLLSKTSGKNSLPAIVLGSLFGLLFIELLGWVIASMQPQESYFSYLKRCFGSAAGTLVMAAYGIYYLCIGGYCAYTFGKLMTKQLLKEQSFYQITAGIVLIAVYGIFKGIEGRARVYEILFWFLILPLVVMLFLACGSIELPRLFPLYTAAEGKDSLKGALQIFGIFSLGGFSLFIVPFAADKEQIKGACRQAVGFSAVLLFFLFGILQGVFGIGAMQQMEYPAVVLMSMVQIPGGFLQRQDAFMVAVWFFTIFALLSSSLFYGAETLKQLLCRQKGRVSNFLAALIIFCIGAGCYRSAAFSETMFQLFLKTAVPFIVCIPLLARLCLQFRRKKIKGKTLLLILVCVCFFSGCSTMELENRRFPLAMGIDRADTNCRISYKFQDLSAIADENADTEKSTDFYIEDTDFFTGISKYANDTNKVLDYNHMKVLILGKEFLENSKAFDLFLEVCQAKDLIARNTLVFVAEDAAKILALDKNLDQSIGTYLEELIESREDYRLKDSVTLGDMYNEWENKEQLLLLPMLEEKGGLPVICQYYGISGGETKGEVSINDTVLSYLSQGKMKKLSFSLEDGTPISIEHIHVDSYFSRGQEIVYHTKIQLEALVENRQENFAADVAEQMQVQLYESRNRLKKEMGIDSTNSFYRLGMSSREKYEKYLGKFENYLEDADCVFEVECRFVQ